MKYINILVVLLSFAGFSSSTVAVQFSVEDISNNVVTCDHNSWLLKNDPIGTCISILENTWLVKAELEKNDDPSILDNVHVVIKNNKGRFAEYSSKTQGWKSVAQDNYNGQLLLTSSFNRIGFETKMVARRIEVGDLLSEKGAKLFMGVRSNNTAGFQADLVRKVFEVQ